MSFAALMTCVLLALTVAAAAYASSPDNNIILAAINNAVTTLQNSITNSQNDINAHTDALAPKSLVLNISWTLYPGDFENFFWLPDSEGKTYSGHITLVAFGSPDLSLEVFVRTPDPVAQQSLVPIGFVEPSNPLLGHIDIEDVLNVDFSGLALMGEVWYRNFAAEEPLTIRIYGVVQYTISTDVETLTVP